MKSLITATLVGAFAIATSFAAEIGKAAPAFTADNVKGEKVSLSDYKDKVVVLEWVNFDCPFVKKHYSSKNMQKLQADYTGKDVVWLTVNSSAEGKQGYLEASKLDEKVNEEGSKATEVLLDTDGTIGKAYGAKVTPHMMIIGKDGKLAYSGAIDSKPSTDAADIDSAEKLFANALDSVISGTEVVNAKNEPYGCGVKY
ncbi:redoxin domain-containing protein [Luteolibacter algae]|uniref:Redoxin domain-containing protein n=1 Tax=Luteolibacter algae TaxID=454151 RepID=A0ABW5D8Q9_9BACT